MKVSTNGCRGSANSRGVIRVQYGRVNRRTIILRDRAYHFVVRTRRSGVLVRAVRCRLTFFAERLDRNVVRPILPASGAMGHVVRHTSNRVLINHASIGKRLLYSRRRERRADVTRRRTRRRSQVRQASGKGFPVRRIAKVSVRRIIILVNFRVGLLPIRHPST